jgi:hypothetical protein
MGYERSEEYLCLWFRAWQGHIMWLLPILALLLPFSCFGAWLVTGIWAMTFLILPALVMGFKGEADIRSARSGPTDLFRLHLLEGFRSWSNFRGLMLFLFCTRSTWAQTPKASAGPAEKLSFLGVFAHFKGALGFSLLAPVLALESRSLLGQLPLSPAALPILYFSVVLLVSVLIFAPSHPAPNDHVKCQRELPPWMKLGASVAPLERGWPPGSGL